MKACCRVVAVCACLGVAATGPARGQGVTNLAAGGFHSLAVRADGEGRAWGWNGRGQLGAGTVLQRRAPAQVRGLSGAAGRYHSLALASNGTVWAWGDNGYGQLGDGTTLQRWMPLRVRPGNGRAVDSDGDGAADIGLSRAATGDLGYRSSLDNIVRTLGVGMPSWLPASADYDGDGLTDLAVFRRATGKIWHKFSLTGAVLSSVAGQPTWLPSAGDYDRDGLTDFSCFIPATQIWRVYQSSDWNTERPRVKLGGPNDRPPACPLVGW